MKVLRTLSLAFLVPAALAAQSQETIENAAASITAEDVIHRIGIIAHDSMMGRDTPSPGLDMTAEYIAREFQRFGLAPGGDEGTFIQRYPLELTKMDTDNPVIVVEGGPSWKLGSDVIQLFGAPTAEPVTGPIKVVWGASTQPTDVASFGLGGAVTFVVLPQPAEGPWFQDANVRNRLIAVLQQSPAAIIAITQRPDESWSSALAAATETSARIPGAQPGMGRMGPILELRDGTIASSLSEHGFDLTAARAALDEPVQSLDLPDFNLTLSLRELTAGEATAPNTVGIIEGSDAELRNEYLVFSGHMDHLGILAPVDGDSIANGADDDASGTIAVVELAEAFSKLHPRPRRSLIFVAVSGEERGLWGSGYFAENPPIPIEQMVANFNADMVGRNWTDTIVVIGKEHSDLGETMNRVNGEHPELGMTAIDDLWPEENFYNRSDHINFARRGVPILFFFNGTHEDYHGVNDEVEKIDGDKTSRIVKLMFYLGLEVANAPEKPKWREGMVP
jgi:hypothetical protein